MKNYKVTMSVLFTPTFEVEANSPEEAKMFAQNEIPISAIEDLVYAEGGAKIIEVEVDMDNVEVDKRTFAQTKEALDRIVKQYIAMVDEFAQYRRESIKWSAEDLVDYPHPTHTISLEQAQVALVNMIKNHDAEYGITWNTIAQYVEDYGSSR
jgi:hypothetical protein